MKVLVYKYTNTINGKVYIGRTSQSIKARAGKNGSNYMDCRKFGEAIKQFGFDKFKCEVLAECSSLEDGDKFEKRFIRLYRSNKSEYGYNLEGGGRKNKLVPKSTRKILSSKSHRRHSPEWVEKCAAGHRGMVHSISTREKMSKSQLRYRSTDLGKLHSEKLRIKLSKKVAKLDNNEDVVEIYSSATEAAKANNTQLSGIVRACNGKLKSCAGFKWCYLQNIEMKPCK